LSAVEQSRLDQLIAGGAFQVDMLDRKGQQYVEQQNINRITNMYGLSANNLASSTAVSQGAPSGTGDLLTAFGTAASEGLFDDLGSLFGMNVPGSQ
jgi:hypothetical protein